MRAQTVHRGAAALAAAALAAVVYATIVAAATNDTAPVSSSPPTISGTPQQGQALAATSGSWNGTTPMTFAYQWQRCNTLGSSCSAIGGASGQTYAVQVADVSSTLWVQVTTNAWMNELSLMEPQLLRALNAPAGRTPIRRIRWQLKQA